MATISIADNDARVQHSIGSGGNTANSTTFTIDFPFFALDDINVIITNSSGVDTTLTRGSGANTFAVSGTAVDDGFSGGNVTLGSVYTSSTVTIFRDIPVTRTTDFATSGPFNIASLNTELDRIIAIEQELETAIGRTLTLPASDATASLVLPNVDTRKGKTLGFNASSGAVEALSQLTTASVAATNTVNVGGSSTASVAVTDSNAAFTFGIPTGATGATGAVGPRGSDAGLDLTWSSATSDADPGAGKLAFNNGTVGSVSIIYIDDVDDHSVNISSFVQSWDDVSNATSRGILLITKEGTSSTYAMFKVTGAVTNASGYSKVAVTHVVSNGTFSNTDGITVQFSYSGNDGSGSLTTVVGDTSPELGGDLDVLARDIVSSSNRSIDLAPNGTGTVVVRGNTNSGTLTLNCSDNSHGQTLKAQLHSSGITNTMLLPIGADSTLVSLVSADTLSNKTLNGVTVALRAVGHVTTDNDGSFDLAVGNDFKCTTAGGLTLTFTNAAAGQSGNIMFINGGNHTIAAHASVAINADVLTAISATGTYHLAYYCSAASGNNTILVSGSAILT